MYLKISVLLYDPCGLPRFKRILLCVKAGLQRLQVKVVSHIPQLCIFSISTSILESWWWCGVLYYMNYIGHPGLSPEVSSNRNIFLHF